jgi:osmoprotectant transport system ATP-binding protein
VLGAPATPFVAEFVGSDRGLKRLSVTPVTKEDLEQPPSVRLTDTLVEARAQMGRSRWAIVLDSNADLAGWIGRDMTEGKGLVGAQVRRMDAWVELGDSLRVAFAEMLQWNAGWIAVLDDGDHYLGVLTPVTLHTALRRSIEADAMDVKPAEVDLETVAEA